MVHDVVIIGGSYAGLSAGLQLARARRRVLVIDAGQRRNRFAAHSHGFLTQDGSRAEDIAAEGRAQLMEYDTVEWLNAPAEAVQVLEDGFVVSTRQRGEHHGRRLILAPGVRDALPAIPGLPERWGVHAFHCPYCHGYELEQGPIGVLATSAMSMHQALLLPDWGPTTFFLNDAFQPDAAQLAQLSSRGVVVEAGPVSRLEGDKADLVLRDGRRFALAGLFLASRSELPQIVASLGCGLEAGPLGDFVKTDATKATTVPGVFACGDAARPAGSVALAVADGALAGTAAHRSLIPGI